MKYEAGKTYKALLPHLGIVVKIHVMYVLDGFYQDEKLIVYRHYGRYKQWWHQAMAKSTELDAAIDTAKKYTKPGK